MPHHLPYARIFTPILLGNVHQAVPDWQLRVFLVLVRRMSEFVRISVYGVWKR